MAKPRVKFVLLNHTERAWRFSVAEVPEALGCGSLSTPPTSPVEQAQAELERLLMNGQWDVEGTMVWSEAGEEGGWVAEVETG